MTFQPHGKHLIDGAWQAGSEQVPSDPVVGPAHPVSVGTAAHVARACEAAEAAFWSYGYSSRAQRAAFLRRIAEEIDARSAETVSTPVFDPIIPRRADISTGVMMRRCPSGRRCRAPICG